MLDKQSQLRWFEGCVYIPKRRRIRTPRYGDLDHKRFDVIYGGKCFLLDSNNEHTTRCAWKAALLIIPLDTLPSNVRDCIQ